MKRLTGKVVPNERDTNVDQVVEPTRHDRLAVVGDDGDEFTLEELVAVEEYVVAEPASGSRNHTRTKIGKGKLERLSIVAGDS